MGRSPAVVAAALAVVASLAGCDAIPGNAEPEVPADALAALLEGGRSDGVEFTDSSTAEVVRSLAGITEGMGGLTPQVEAGDTSTDGATRSVQLRWTWDLPTGQWSYDTTAELDRSDDGWRVAWSPELVEPSLAAGELLDLTPVPAARGPITGADDKMLVADRPVLRIGIDKTQVGARRGPGSARRLAALLDIDASGYARRVREAGDKAFVEGLVLRQRDVPSVLRSIGDIPGAAAVADEIPLAPTRSFAAPILGSVGPVTAEMVERSDGAFAAGDVAGLSGLQARYDAELDGSAGVVVEAVDPEGKERTIFEAEPVPGAPLRTTLDVDLQIAAEQALSDVGPASALVAIQPSNGNVLVAASGPGSQGLNTATFGQYAPGSTFKVVTTLALLRSGLTTTSAVPCTRTVTVDGKEFENYDDYPPGGLGEIPLRTAVANSCNTAFLASRNRVQDTALVDAAAALGLGVDHDLGFPAYFGQVPDPETETEAAADLIGQGRVLASPLTMAAVLASVMQGKTVLPRLLPDHQPDQVAPAEPLTGQEAAALTSMLQGVVTDGSGAFLADVPGPRVLAKTGTAEYGDASPPDTHAWMIAGRKDLAVAVFVEKGESGSRTAGPILEQFLRAAR